jgi:1-acyl-sn-glycerol-3-phosphate acyltransferase
MAEALLQELAWRLARAPFAELQKRRALRIQRHSDRMLRLLDIRTEIRNLPANLPAGLIVCNHLSYIDVLVMARTFPALFITSMEVKHSTGLGQITRLAGCLFVERRSRAGLGTETGSIAAVLRAGTSVVLFPEGTSTNGHGVLPFRAALYQAAIDANVPIHSFHLRYDSERIPYYGDLEFVPHLRALSARGPVHATLTYLSEIRPDPETDRKWLASETYASVLREHVSGI